MLKRNLHENCISFQFHIIRINILWSNILYVSKHFFIASNQILPFRKISQEVVLTQQLLDARRRETETESHLKQLCVRQVGRIESEIVRLAKSVDEYKDRANTIQSDIFKGNERLDEFKLEMNWQQEQLEQWALAARQKEEDEIALER